MLLLSHSILITSARPILRCNVNNMFLNLNFNEFFCCFFGIFVTLFKIFMLTVALKHIGRENTDRKNFYYSHRKRRTFLTFSFEILSSISAKRTQIEKFSFLITLKMEDFCDILFQDC